MNKQCEHNSICWDFKNILCSDPPKYKGHCNYCSEIIYEECCKVISNQEIFTITDLSPKFEVVYQKTDAEFLLEKIEKLESEISKLWNIINTKIQ